jgi:hypothetical protein
VLYDRFALWWHSTACGKIIRLFVALSIRTVVAILSAAYMVTAILAPLLSNGEGREALGVRPRMAGSTGVRPHEDTIMLPGYRAHGIGAIA